MRNSRHDEIRRDLVKLLPEGRVLVDEDVIRPYCHDEAAWAPYGQALSVVRPHSTLEVQSVVKFCIKEGLNLVPRGAGTGLSGGANALDDSIVISLERMNSIVEINHQEHLAVVQAGVINSDLRKACERQELWYPPDPASAQLSTIGGNVATNAGGICCVKYGVTREYVLALEMVNGLGDVIRLGRRTAKGVAGYDLAGLIVGSEGTLGIVTEVTVRLRPLRPSETTIAGQFSSIVDAGRAATAIVHSGVVPSALELIDRHCLEAVDAWKNMGLSINSEAVLLARVDTQGDIGRAHAEQILKTFQSSGATWAAVSTDEQESEALFDARRLAYLALERLGPIITEDVCVPVGAVSEMLGRIEAISQRRQTFIAIIAHIGDGNLHPLLIATPGDIEATNRALSAFDDILSAAIELGGTVTGEHGVGLLKRAGLAKEMSSEVIEMHRAVKRALDPHGIFNIQKIFSP